MKHMHPEIKGKGLAVLVMVLMVACQNKAPGSGKEAKAAAAMTRKSVVDTSKAVATYTANMEDQVTDNDFIVKIFPTSDETLFKADIRYGGNEVQEEISMLPKSYYKRIALKKKTGDGQCILGFTDTEGTFNEMKLITASRTSIGIKTLRTYYLSTQ